MSSSDNRVRPPAAEAPRAAAPGIEGPAGAEGGAATGTTREIKREAAIGREPLTTFDSLIQAARTDAHEGHTMTLSLVTRGQDGWPVTSLLGCMEVLVTDATTLRLAIWPTARAHRNLCDDGRATLDFVHDARFFQLRLRAIRQMPIQLPAEQGGNESSLPLVCHELVLVSGEAQQVPYAALTSGIRYALQGDAVRRQQTLQRWRSQQQALQTV